MSVDKVTVDYKLRGPNEISALGKLVNRLEIRYAVKINQWESFKIGRYRQNYTITFQDGNSYWVGVALNSVKTEWTRVRLEVNPNKCAQHASFLEVLAYMNENSRPQSTTIKRFDMAVDIPIEREKASLIKDGRVYSEIQHGKRWTEYLGAQASHIGRVKLYNKQAEAGLAYPLTRLEITLDPTTGYEKLPWPKAYYIGGKQAEIGKIEITDTERYILTALLAGHGSTKDLGRKTKEKMERLLAHYVQYIRIEESDYQEVKKGMRSLLEYPESDLKLGRIDADQARRT